MITIKHGSIFDSRAAVLVCPVNCVGVMGKGLALEFKRRFPYINAAYQNDCGRGVFTPGTGVIYEIHMPVGLNSRYIFCLATKKDWRQYSELGWIISCLESVVGLVNENTYSIAIPQLGCGCGGLDWADVWPLYEKHLGGLDADVEVWIHESH